MSSHLTKFVLIQSLNNQLPSSIYYQCLVTYSKFDKVCGSETVSPASISSSSVEDTYSIRIDYPYHPDHGIWSW